MKKIAIALVSGFLLTGCYAHICPTYSVKPDKNEIQKTVKVEEAKNQKSS